MKNIPWTELTDGEQSEIHEREPRRERKEAYRMSDKPTTTKQHCPKCGALAIVTGKLRLNEAFEATQLDCPNCGYMEHGHRIYAELIGGKHIFGDLTWVGRNGFTSCLGRIT